VSERKSEKGFNPTSKAKNNNSIQDKGVYRVEDCEADFSFIEKYDNEVTVDQYVSESMNDPLLEYLTPYGEQDWQIQLRLHPSQDNLRRAALALLPIMEEHNLEYKLLKLAGDTPSLGYDPTLDYNLEFATHPRPDIDRPNRHCLGQEFCIKIALSSIKNKAGLWPYYQYTPNRYKNIVLQCIKQLQVLGIQFGSFVAPMGANNIPCEKGIPPLASYSLTGPKPKSDARHTVLLSRDHNPNNYLDPFHNVKITYKDLERHEIDIEALKADGKKRIEKQSDHLQLGTSECEIILLYIWKYRTLRSFKHPELETVPLVPENEHQPFIPADAPRPLSDSQRDAYSEFIESEKFKTIQDFQENPFALSFIKKHLMDHEAVRNFRSKLSNEISDADFSYRLLFELVTNNLKAMQILFLRLIHIEHEQKNLKNSLIFMDDVLPQLTETIQIKLKSWQNYNEPLIQYYIRTFKELDKLPNAGSEENLKIRMEIIDFFDSALPSNLRLTNTFANYTSNSEHTESEENRKAVLCAKLKNLAQTLDGKGPTWGKVLGLLLIVGGLLVGTLTLLSLIPSLGLTAIPGVTLSTSMILGGASFFGGVAVAGAITSYCSRDKGLSKEVQNLASAVYI